jgi:hypothetical protein
MRYSCAINGTCEPDVRGRHPDLITCQANCVPYEGEIIPDILYDILALNLEDAIKLAPSDISIILFRITGIRASLTYARGILTKVIDNDYLALWRYEEEVKDYVRAQLTDELDLLILDTSAKEYRWVQPDWDALRNKVIRRITEVFEEADVGIEELFENEPPPDMEDLLDFLQGIIATDIYSMATGDSNKADMEGFMKHWDYVVERFGGVIPYQRYIGI